MFDAVAINLRLGTLALIGLWAVSGAPARHTELFLRSDWKGRFRYSDLKEAGRATEAYVV